MAVILQVAFALVHFVLMKIPTLLQCMLICWVTKHIKYNVILWFGVAGVASIKQGTL